jgi:hypothetical protein
MCLSPIRYSSGASAQTAPLSSGLEEENITTLSCVYKLAGFYVDDFAYAIRDEFFGF